MTEFSKSTPAVKNFALLASWLEEPCHLNAKRHGLRDFTLTESLRHIAAANGLLHSDTDNSDRIKAANNGSLSSGSDSGRLTHKPEKAPELRYNKSWLPTDLQHPGVTTLLDEYYKLTTAQASKTSVSHKYCPSFKTQMWQSMTATLPPPLRFSSVIGAIRSLAESTAPEQRMPIVALLVAWLYLFKLLVLMKFVHPFILVSFACIGIYILSWSEEKLQAAVKRKFMPGHILTKKFLVGERLKSHHLQTSSKAVNGSNGGSSTD